MKKIELTRGQVALVDDEDYDKLNQYKWFATKKELKSRVNWYADRQYRHAKQKNKKGHAKQMHESMHRVIMGAKKGQHTDHRDGNGLNNQRSNLRLCTHRENMWNQEWTASPDKPYKGVKKYRSKKNPGWHALITYKGETILLGWFKSAETAAKCYDKLAIALFGEYARLNFPEILS